MGKRNLGIDLLKLLSMYMVVILHILSYSGLLEQTLPGGDALWLLEMAAYSAVNLFAMTTGFLMADRPFRYRKFLVLWVQVLFWSVLGTVVLSLIFPSAFGIRVAITTLFPVTFLNYWYFTAYAGMFFFIPFFNRLIESLSRRNHFRLILTCLLVFSVLPTVRCDDIFFTKFGYSALWLSVMYLIGAYIRKYPVAEKIRKRTSVLVYLGSVLVSWGFKIVVEFAMGKLGIHTEVEYAKALFQYTSPTVVLAAVALFVLFLRLPIPEKSVWAKIARLSPYAFGVYLIHMHPLFKQNVLPHYAGLLASVPGWAAVPTALLLSLVLFSVCLLLDAGRSFLFARLRIPEMLNALADCTVKRVSGWKWYRKLTEHLTKE